MFATLFAAVLLTAGPVKPSAAGRKLVGAWYEGDTQYMHLKPDGTGRLGMLTMQWSVETQGTLHLLFTDEGGEKDVPYTLLKGSTLRFFTDGRSDLDLVRKKAKDELKGPQANASAPKPKPTAASAKRKPGLKAP